MTSRPQARPLQASRALVAAIIAVVGLVGCDALTGPSELERTIALEQKVITAYAAEIPKIDALTVSFADAWRRANEHRDLAVYRSDLNAHAVVDGRALVAALEAIPLGSQELKALHEPLVGAYRALVDALAAFASGPASVSFDAAYAPVLSAYEALRAAEGVYQRGVETWYAKNRMTLVPAPNPLAPTSPASKVQGDAQSVRGVRQILE